MVSRCDSYNDCPIRTATLTSSKSGVTICPNQKAFSTITFTCVSSPMVPTSTPVTYKFFFGKGIAQATSSNTYTITYDMFQYTNAVAISSAVVTPGGPDVECYTPSSNSVMVTKCN